MNAVANAKSNLPNLKNDGRMHVQLSGNHFQQNKVNIPNNGNVINIYCLYKLDLIASSRDTSVQDLFIIVGAVMLIKKLRDFIYPKVKTFDLINYKNEYKVIRNKVIRNKKQN